ARVRFQFGREPCGLLRGRHVDTTLAAPTYSHWTLSEQLDDAAGAFAEGRLVELEVAAARTGDALGELLGRVEPAGGAASDGFQGPGAAGAVRAAAVFPHELHRHTPLAARAVAFRSGERIGSHPRPRAMRKA